MLCFIAVLTGLSADIVLSSGEESLAEFVAGLDSSESFPGGKGKQKVVTTPLGETNQFFCYLFKSKRYFTCFFSF